MAILLGAQLLASVVPDDRHPQGSGDGAESLARQQDELAPLAQSVLAAGLSDLSPLPIPAIPSGAEPLSQALEQYVAQRGGSIPPGVTQILGLDAEAEGALARLVLAFLQASSLQTEAVSALSPDELALFSGQLDAPADWQSAHPEASLDDLEAHLMEVSAKADAPKLAQAADLLFRTIDEVRVPLSRPLKMDRPGPAAAQAQETTAWDLVRSAASLQKGAPQTAPSLAQAVRDLAAAYGLDPATVPPLPALLHPTLDGAIAGIVEAHALGIASGDPAIHAAAVLDAAEKAAPTLQAWEALLSLDARVAPEPDMHALVASLVGGGATPISLLSASRAQPVPAVPSARPLSELLAPYGLSPNEAAAAIAGLPPQAAAALALTLEGEAILAAAYESVVDGLSEQDAAFLLATPSVASWSDDAAWTPEQAAVIEGWAHSLGQLDPTRLDDLAAAQARAAAAVAAAAALLSSPNSAPPGLPVPVPGLPAPPVPAPCIGSPNSDCPNDVLLEISQGGGILVTGSGQTTINGRFAGGDPHIIIDLGGDDFYTVSAGGASGGFGVPGNAAGPLMAVLLLPGNGYVYGPWHQSDETIVANARAMRFFAVAIDSAGNDRYESSSSAGQGAAIGLGTLGILWDRAGDDTYVQTASEEGNRTFQGSGDSGGLGILVDESGNDDYEAPFGFSQGSGLAPIFALQVTSPCGTETGAETGLNVCTGKDRFDREDLAGIGILADLGDGNDAFKAASGQGHGHGYGTVGILYDEAGATSYAVTPASLASQGGQAPSASGFAALIDLGGAGDTYTAPPFPLDEEPIRTSTEVGSAGILADDWVVVKHNVSQPVRKGDETLWIHAQAGLSGGVQPTPRLGLALGIDSTLVDEDGDGHFNLAELLAGTDAHNETESPDDLVTNATERIEALIEAAGNITDDKDGDSYPDFVEATAGTDPNDPQSTPGPSDAGFLVTLPILCAETATTCAMPCAGPTLAKAPPTCVSLLSIGGPGPTRHNRTAIIELDLEGNDTYSVAVAGAGSFLAGGQVRTAGSISLDVGGDDAYDTPALSSTQAFASAGASLLLDLDGNDTYRAQRQAQGASTGGIAILADFGGDDRYEAVRDSQGDYTGVAFAGITPAVEGIGPGGAALVDLRGNDTYVTRTQATLRDAASERVFATALDAAGVDHYSLTLDSQSPFAAQGRMETSTAQEDRVDATGRRALFVDLGDEADVYHGVVGGGVVDQSSQKNGAVLHDNAADAGAAVFSDGLAEDDDGDGFPSWAEALAGSDPKDAGSVPVGPDGTPLHLAPGAGTGIRLPGLSISGPGDDVHLTRFDFMVDLDGNDQYLAPYLGGTTPLLHGTAGQPQSATVVLDLGGDDTYRPAPCVVDPPALQVSSLQTIEPTGTDGITSTSPRGGQAATGQTAASALNPIQLLFCPALGAAAMGVAVLADQGGENVFEASSSVNFTVDAMTGDGSAGNSAVHVRAWDASLGASLFSGAGILAAWEGKDNRFNATLDVNVREIHSGNVDPQADAFTLTQGAAYGHGLGLLISTGGGDDSYNAAATAKAPHATGDDGGRERAYAQGAGMGGIGMLIDDGGDNRFLAADGFAQGHASPLLLALGSPGARTDALVPLGLLWSGPGDDEYLGGGASQASAGIEFVRSDPLSGVSPYDVARPSVGALLDTGGNDAYLLAPAPSPGKVRYPFCPLVARRECGLAQGAADNGGVGLLVDWAGDDRHEAQGRTHVQGAGRRGGFGALLDLSGNDVYRAESDSQAFADGGLGKTAAAGGLLVDLMGRDSYQLTARGQGYSAGGRPINLRDILPGLPDLPAPLPALPYIVPFNEAAQFIDLAGLDHYGYGTGKQPLPAGSEPSDDGNDWLWTQRTDATTALPVGLGVDAEGIDAAVQAYQGSIAPDLATVDLCVRIPGGPCLEDGASIDREVELVATASPGPAVAVQRVSILLDGTLLGVAEPTQDPDTYVLAWNTTSNGLSDGRYQVAAVAWVSSGQPGDLEPGAAAPDGVSVSSADVAVAIDNAPTGSATLSRDAVSPAIPATQAVLTVDVGPDLASPGEPGGATVRVRLAPASGGAPLVISDEFRPSGTVGIPVTGACGATACPDGAYIVEVRLTDAGGKVLDLPGMPLFIDGTPPSSVLVMPVSPAVANAGYLVGADGLQAVWMATDSGSGVKEVVARQVTAEGSTIAQQTVSHPTNFATFTGIASGSEVFFVTAAVDRLGNVEPTNATDIVSVLTDFNAPSVFDLVARPPVARPGVDVTLEAVVLDPEDTLEGVFVSAGGARQIPAREMTLTGEEGARKVYSTVVVFEDSVDPEGEEAPYVFTVQASDEAGNANPGETAAAILDSRAPRVSLLQEVYRDGAEEVPKGRPGAIAQFTLLSEDYKTAQVEVDATTLGLSVLPCTDQSLGRLWMCPITIPEGTLDGLYDLPAAATDEAGNVADFTLTLAVDRLPPPILDAHVVAVGPDYIEVSWNTAMPTLGYVQYGRTTSLGRETDPDEERSLHHVVRVTDLNPSARYHLRPVSVSESNAANLTADLLVATTSDAFTLTLVDFPTFPDWGAARNVSASVQLLLGTEPVSVLVKVQDAQRRASPLPMAARSVGNGTHHFSVDTSLLPDGEYRVIAEGARQGAVIRTESAVFRVDNTAPVVVPVAPRPGATVGQPRPALELAVVDPLRQDFPDPSSVLLVIDDEPVTPAQSLRQGNLGAQAKFVVLLPADLTDGRHDVLVRVTDSAGNTGEVEWDFKVDSSAPDATVVALRYDGGAPVGRPAGPGRAWLKLNDLSGVSAVELDLRPWDGLRVPMFAHSNGTWSAQFAIPGKVPDGRIEIPINATDANGHQGLAGTLPIDVDAVAPGLRVEMPSAASLTSLRVKATTNEPATLSVAARDRMANGTSGTQHSVLLPGLTPGTTYWVTVAARDVAGNAAQNTSLVAMPADGEAPGAPQGVKATPREDGVFVQWEPAKDNAGVDHYVIARVQGSSRTDIEVAGATHWLDTEAIAGPVLYRVHAVDVAGLAGAAVEASTFLHVPAQLEDAAISPRQASANRPFTVRVTFTHPAGIEPDAVVLHHAGQSFPLARIGDESCMTGCVYGGKFRFPAISTVQSTSLTYIEATVEGIPTRLALEAPLVTVSGMAFEEADPHGAPAPGILLALAALAAALVWRRGGRR